MKLNHSIIGIGFSLAAFLVSRVAVLADAPVQSLATVSVVTAPLSVVNVGATETMAVSQPTGDSAVSYQWMLDGAPIANATSSTYTVTAVGATDGGDYSVVLTNAAGSATMEVGVLQVAATD